MIGNRQAETEIPLGSFVPGCSRAACPPGYGGRIAKNFRGG